jgi:hypothetical protein
MPAPTDAELRALIELLVCHERDLMARQAPTMAHLFAEHAERLKVALPGMTHRQLQSGFKDVSEYLFTLGDPGYRAAMDKIRAQGLEPAFTHMVANKYTRVLRNVLKRGAIRNVTEAHAVKNAVDNHAAPGLEDSDLHQLALLYEQYIARQ